MSFLCRGCCTIMVIGVLALLPGCSKAETVNNSSNETVNGTVVVITQPPVNNATNNSSVTVNATSTNQTTVAATNASQAVAAPVAMPQHYCPAVEELTKEDMVWTARNVSWKSFTSSTASKVLSFTGAQWSGIKVGKVICLYSTNEAVPFPLALEEVKSHLVLEPKSMQWSGLVGNRKLCKSASVADCYYYFEETKPIADVYQELEYNPAKN